MAVGRGSPWSLSCLPVERADLDHLCDPRRRVVGWLAFWLVYDLCLRDLLWHAVALRAVVRARPDGRLRRSRRCVITMLRNELLSGRRERS